MATIDIFVIDNITDDEKKEKRRREDVKFVLSVADSITEENCLACSLNNVRCSVVLCAVSSCP